MALLSFMTKRQLGYHQADYVSVAQVRPLITTHDGGSGIAGDECQAHLR